MTRETPSGAATGATVAFHVHIRKGERGRRRMRTGTPKPPKPVELGHIPRISRLMALAIHYDHLMRKGVVKGYAEIARLGGLSRARVSQIMDLLNLAPEIQEEILFLPRVVGKEEVTERSLRGLRQRSLWETQRQLWFRPGTSVQEGPPAY